MEGVSTYSGFSLGKTGLDFVGDKPAADPKGKLVGAQVSIGTISAGVDAHVAQTDTVTTGFINWKDVWKKVISWAKD